MSLWDLCIRRPVFTAMIVLAPAVLGLASLARLNLDLMPNVDMATVVVTTSLPGASVEEVETTVTKVIEEAVNTISGIDELKSTSSEGSSQVIIQFNIEKSGAVAAQEVESKVRTIVNDLPDGATTPIVDKANPDSSPVLSVAISGRRDPREVTQIARKQIKESIENLGGVGSVTLIGGRRRAVQVIIDPKKLQQFESLTVEDVRRALVDENQERPGGRIDQGRNELTIRTMGRMESPSSFSKLIVANRNGRPVRIEDVARVEDSFEEPRGLGRLWVRGRQADDAMGGNAVCLNIVKQTGTNTVEVVRTVKDRLEELRKALPDDIQMEVTRDQSRFVEASIHEVKIHLVLAAVLVSLTILLFIRDWRTTLIASAAIPTSMIGTLAFMDYMGFTLNNLTMLGLILSIGIVVDDAVVVHENIFRHMEEDGKTGAEAASSATREIALAVMATTLSLLVIFAPVAFMGGKPGRFFSSFGFVAGFSILMSMAISFTLTPMLCARFLVLEKGHAQTTDGPAWRLISGGYCSILGWSLRHRWTVVAASLAILATTPLIGSRLGFEFMPKDDQSEFEIAATLPEGYSLGRAGETFHAIDLKLRQLPGVEYTYTVIGDTSGRNSRGEGSVTSGTIYVRLVDLTARDYSQFDVMRSARAMMEEFPDLKVTVQEASAIAAAGMSQVLVDLNIRGPDMAKLQELSEQTADWMRKRGGFVDVSTSLSMTKPELRVRPNRERLSDLGVSLASVSNTASILVGGDLVTSFKEADEQYDVWLRADRRLRGDVESIAAMPVPSSKAAGGVVRLGNLVRFDTARGPNSIERMSRQRQVVVSSNLDGMPLSEAVDELTQHVEAMGLPVGYGYEFTGQAKMLKETNGQFGTAFILAFLFMYMVLAAQFESFFTPVSILAALPVTIPFALVSMLLLGSSLDLYSLIGLLMLVGIVKKNGILQVDYTNQLRARGMPRYEACIEANRTRLRPILMTTIMLIAAMIPMALGEGPGAAARAGMAKLILGGQSLSLLLTLLITPVAYTLLDDLAVFAGRLRGRNRPGSHIIDDLRPLTASGT